MSSVSQFMKRRLSLGEAHFPEFSQHATGLEGWLEFKKRIPTTHTYKRRYVKQIGSKLFYSEDERSKEAQGKIDLDSGFEVQTTREHAPKGTISFAIKTANRTYNLAAPEDKFKYWTDGLTKYLSDRNIPADHNLHPERATPHSSAESNLSADSNRISISSIDALDYAKRIEQQQERILHLEELLKQEEKEHHKAMVEEKKKVSQDSILLRTEFGDLKQKYIYILFITTIKIFIFFCMMS